MSSIEKALERLITSKNKTPADGSTGFGTVENISNDSEATNVPDDIQQSDTAVFEGEVSLSPENEKNEYSDKRIFHMDYKRLKDAGYLTPGDSHTPLAEEYRLIKRHLITNAFGKGAAPVENGNLIVVTSAVPGEGKTYTSINLAMSIALELDSTVLLVDGDILKAEMSKDLGLSDQPGLMELLKPKGRKYEISDVILSTDLPRLKIIPAGSLQENPTELLASERMRQITEELSRRYSNRIILFDAPPILATTEALSLIDHMGQVMFVVEAGKTPTEHVEAAVSQINSEKVIGTILNKNRYKTRDGYYGGYYGKKKYEREGDGNESV